MLKKKIITIILLASLLAINTFIYPSDAKKTKALEGSVSDYRTEFINKDWWDSFNDTYLSEYIIKAAYANQDLKIATLKVLETQSKVQETFGKEFPIFNLGADMYRQKTSDNVYMGSFHIPKYTQNNFLFPLSMNYELDLWQKNRDKTKSVKKELDMAKFDEKSAFISLTSTVAASYFNIVRLDKLVEVQNEIVNIRKNLLDLYTDKNNYGLCPITDVIEAEKNLTEAQTSLTEYQKQRDIFLNQLAVLMGQSVDNAKDFKRISFDELKLSDIQTEIKSDFILKRPDILKAEAQIQKAKIDINIARKDFLPDINISGQLGFNANDFSKTFNQDSTIASIGTGIAQTLFSGGQRKANLKIKKYRYDQTMENYQKTILKSFQELNDSLISFKADKQKLNDNINRVNLEQKNFELINYKYTQGALAYLDTLERKARLIQLKKDEIQSKSDCYIDLLSIYKATGGKNLVNNNL